MMRPVTRGLIALAVAAGLLAVPAGADAALRFKSCDSSALPLRAR